MSSKLPDDNLITTDQNTPEEPQAAAPQAFVDGRAMSERTLAMRRKWARGIRVIIVTYVAAFLVLLVVSLFDYLSGYQGESSGFMYLLALVNLLVGILTYRLIKDPVPLLDAQTDIRPIGPLIEVLLLRDAHFGFHNRVRKPAGDALTLLLAHLLASSDLDLTAAQRVALTKIALKENNGKLVTTIIDVLAEIGREESILPLEALSAFGSRYDGKEARDAARQALIRVRERAEKDKVHSVLLRPTEGDPSQEPMLVRPASGPAALDESSLLRTPEEQEIQRVGS